MFLVQRLILVGLDVGIASRVGFHDFSLFFSLATARGLIKKKKQTKKRQKIIVETKSECEWGGVWSKPGPQLDTSSLSSGNF